MKSKIKLNDEIRKQIVSEIKMYFLEEREEEIGDLAARLFLDFITEHIGPSFYNQGIKDSILFMNEKIEDLYSLEIY